MDNTQQSMLHSYQAAVVQQNIEFLLFGVLLLATLVILAKYRPSRGKPRRKARTGRIPVDNNYGDAGERMVQHQLQFLGPEYVVMNDVLLAGGGQRQQIDHLVVGPTGIFHVETKHWSGAVLFDGVGMQHIKNGVLTDDSDPTVQMDRHDYVVRSVLAEYDIHADVMGIICFTHPRCQLVGASPRYATIKLDRLFGMIQANRPSRSLKPTEVQRIAAILERHSQPTPVGYGQR
ncbi:MAG: NERD domain-containing protein [Alicyclobacillus sp.]|nr:NERD domain-containing protein [Alicyclobacillus sp.]